MKSKHWFLSKTILFHAFTLAAYIVTYILDHHLATNPDVLRAIVTVQAVVGFVLRFFTNSPVGRTE